jgi:hypothetical protein
MFNYLCYHAECDSVNLSDTNECSYDSTQVNYLLQRDAALHE